LAKVLAVSGREVSLVEAAAELNRQFSRNSSAVIFAHLFYDDLVRVMVDGYLAQLAGKADIFVSITRGVSHESVQYIKERCGNVYVHLVENRGRDVKPFMEMLHIAAGMGYEFGFKVHGKRSPHRRDGAEWRDQLISPLLGSPEIFDSNLKLLSDQRIGMLIPRGNRVDLGVPEIHAGNVKWLNYLLRGMGAADKIGKYDFHFSAGTMFAFRLAALADLWEKPCFSTENFEPESGQIDGTFAHAVERVLLHSTTLRGFTSKEI
jgi:lipopolysaccharide biosynthesis protein